MCLSCHSGLSDAKVKEDLQRSLSDPKYKQWNDVSLAHIILAATGMNGRDVQDIAVNILENYVKWGEENPEDYKTWSFDMESFPIGHLKKAVSTVINELVPHSKKYTQDQIKAQFYDGDEKDRTVAELVVKNIQTALYYG